MNQSPLASLHSDAGATMTTVDDWSIPEAFSSTEAECAAASQGAGLLDLAHIGTISLEGPDARRFANGMFTNNIRDLEVGQCGRSAMCDDRGRVQGLLDVYCTDTDRFEGVLEGVTAEWFESRYEMYIVFDDVEMEVSQGEPWVLSIQGPEAAAVLTRAGLPTPLPGHHIQTDSGTRIVNKDRTGLGGFDVVVSTADIEDTWKQLIDAGACAMGHGALDQLRIQNGRASWPTDGTEKSLVHELGINEEVCNFNKGCYLGQEVINRIDVKGQVNKRIHRIHVEGNPENLVGSAVFVDEKQVGTITSAAHVPEGTIALSVLRKAAWGENQQVQISSSSGDMTGTVLVQP
jgi:folate-binding protein YgfZ